MPNVLVLADYHAMRHLAFDRKRTQSLRAYICAEVVVFRTSCNLSIWVSLVSHAR